MLRTVYIASAFKQKKTHQYIFNNTLRRHLCSNDKAWAIKKKVHQIIVNLIVYFVMSWSRLIHCGWACPPYSTNTHKALCFYLYWAYCKIVKHVAGISVKYDLFDTRKDTGSTSARCGFFRSLAYKFNKNLNEILTLVKI